MSRCSFVYGNGLGDTVGVFTTAFWRQRGSSSSSVESISFMRTVAELLSRFPGWIATFGVWWCWIFWDEILKYIYLLLLESELPPKSHIQIRWINAYKNFNKEVWFLTLGCRAVGLVCAKHLILVDCEETEARVHACTSRTYYRYSGSTFFL